MVKTCRICGEVKSLTEFHKKKDSKDGLNSMCKVCKNAKSREAHAADPEKQHGNRRRQQALYPWKSTFRTNWYGRGAATRIEAEKELMRAFYANCPTGCEVDHIVPLSEGGAHTMDNVRYLEAKENRSLGSKLRWSRR